MNPKALQKLSYGVYIITSRKGDKANGQIANTVIQVTSEPLTVAVSINKQNLTHEYIEASKVFVASILSQSAPLSLIGTFGFKSGRDTNKLEGVNCKVGETQTPIVVENSTAYLEVRVKQQMDVGTHSIFVGEVVAAEALTEDTPMTYAYYHEIKRGVTPKTAATYIAEPPKVPEKPQDAKPKAEGLKPKMDKYVCSVCGYVYDPAAGDPDGGIPAGTSFESLPDTWVCPVCGASKEDFRKA